MNTNQGALYFGAGIDLNQWRRDVDSMRRDIVGLTRNVESETRNVDSAFKNLSIGIAGYFSVNALKNFAMELINVRGEFQKTEIAYSTMLGSSEKAKNLMGQMVELAQKTPFSFSEVATGAKQLLAFQVPANQVVDTLTRMGNIASGLGVPISRLNLVYGQVMAKGRLMGDDLRQFTEAGIPMVAELAKKFNTTSAAVTDMVSAGKIGFKDVQDVLFNLTNEGGMFFNLMEKQSASLSGKVANLGDNWEQMFNKIGAANEGILYGGIEGLNYLVENYQEVLNTIEALVIAYGSYKAAVIVASSVQTFANKTIQSEIALLSISEKMKLGRAMVTQRQAEATARDTVSELANARAKYASLQTEVSSLSIKRQQAIQSGITATAKAQEARVQLALARMELSSIQATGTAREIEIAQKRVTTAQNTVIATQETAAIARKRALAAATQFNTTKQQLENTAQTIGVATRNVATASEAAQIAAKNANAIATARLTLVTRIRTAATQLATQAQVLLNATMLNNPIVLVIAAVAGLTYAYFRLRDTTTSLSIAEKQLNSERQKASQIIDDLKNKTQELTAIINSETATKLQQLEAYKQMQAMYPSLLKDMDVETFKKLDSTEAQKKLNAEIDKFSTKNLQGNVIAAQNQIQNLTQKLERLKEALKTAGSDRGIVDIKIEQATKNLEAQKIILDKYNSELKVRLENEKISSMSLAEQKKYWEDQIVSINTQISAQEKSNSKKAESIDKLNNISSLTKTTSANLLNWNITPFLSQLDRAKNELNKINNAQSDTGVNKNKGFWEQQKKAAEDANDAMSGKDMGSAGWKANIKKIREATEELKKYDYTDKEALKAQKARDKERKLLDKGAEKSYLEGSIKRYDQQISLLEDALSRSNGNSVQLRYVDKYGKEKNSAEVRSLKSVQDELLKLRIDRAAREKLIETKSFQEKLEEGERQWNNYYKMAEFYGKETADAQYKELFKGSANYLQYLENEEQKLKDLQAQGILTPKQKEDLTFIGEKINSLNGTETDIEIFKRGFNNDLNNLRTIEDQLDLIEIKRDEVFQKEGTNSKYFTDVNKVLIEIENQLKEQQQQNYRQLLNDHKSYSQRRIQVEEDAAKAIKKIREDANILPENKVGFEKSIDKKAKEEISQLAVDELTQSQAWMALYGNIDDLTAYQMDVLIRELESKQGNLAKVLTRVDFRILLKNFRDVKNKISEENPFLGMFNSLQELFSAFGAQSEQVGEQAYTSFERASEGIRGTLNATKGIIGAISPAREYLSDTANDAIDTIEQVVTMGIGMMQAVDGTVKAVSSAIKSATWSNWITALIQIIYTAIRAIVSLFTWIAGNKTKKINKQIKEYQSVLNGLEQTYNDLALAAEKAYGSMKYDVQRESIKNLQEQQKVLEDMKEAESKKKKADQAKIDSYNDQQQENIRKIEDLKNEILRDVLQTDVPEMASRIGDALIEAFGKGVDGIEGINKAFDDMIRNIMRNQLNKVLEKQLAPVYENILKAAGFDKDGNGTFNGFSESEISDLRNQILAASTKGQEFINAWSGLFKDLEISTPESLKGDIKGITEKTAGALEAQFNAFRINLVALLQVAKQNNIVQNAHTVLLSQIEVNTRNLVQIRKDMQELNSKVKKNLAGVP
ncbi:MAG: tape measure protein [Myroides sp.]